MASLSSAGAARSRMSREESDDRQEAFLVANPEYSLDYRRVVSFLDLRSTLHRPIDETVSLRQAREFKDLRAFLPRRFFAPFNQLCRLLGHPEPVIEPKQEHLDVWNRQEYVKELVARTTHALDTDGFPWLIPNLVSVYENLNHQRHLPRTRLTTLSGIVVPGSRSFDRVIEAFRYYRLGKGCPYLITTGKAPYWDSENRDVHLTEAEANAAYWRMLGAPPDRILAESESQDTSENADFLLDVLGRLRAEAPSPIRILLVTTPFHLARYRLNVEMTFRRVTDVDIYAVGSTGSRYYGAEFYFYTDPKAGYDRSITLGTVFQEYLKIAFDLCASKRPVKTKVSAALQSDIASNANPASSVPV